MCHTKSELVVVLKWNDCPFFTDWSWIAINAWIVEFKKVGYGTMH